MTNKIKLLRDAQPDVLLDASSWEKLSGDPHTVNLNAYASEDGTKTMGTWICTPGWISMPTGTDSSRLRRDSP